MEKSELKGTNNENNPSSYTVESGAITLQEPTKVGYTFIGWTGSNGSEAQTGVVIPAGSNGNKTYNAVWQTNTDTPYTVFHYVKIAGEDRYLLSMTEELSGTTDEYLTLSSLAKESELLYAHYSSGSLTGTEFGPGEIITQTIIKGDGSTVIYLYYTRNTRTVTLSGDAHIQTLEGDDAVRECGSEVPVNAIPKPGYHFVRWDREEDRKEEENVEIPGL